MGLVSQHAQGLLGAATEDTLDARDTESVDEILRQSERDQFGDGKFATLQDREAASSVSTVGRAGEKGEE